VFFAPVIVAECNMAQLIYLVILTALAQVALASKLLIRVCKVILLLLLLLVFVVANACDGIEFRLSNKREGRSYQIRCVIQGGKVVNADRAFFADVLVDGGIIVSVASNIQVHPSNSGHTFVRQRSDSSDLPFSSGLGRFKPIKIIWRFPNLQLNVCDQMHGYRSVTAM
jgi:hypothetical protein